MTDLNTLAEALLAEADFESFIDEECHIGKQLLFVDLHPLYSLLNPLHTLAKLLL
jgi:hypothetical protein